MNPHTQSQSGFSAITKSSDRSIEKSESIEAKSATRCKVFTFENYAPSLSLPPAGYQSVSDLLAEWETDETLAGLLREGRRWVGETFYGEDGETVRTLRLRKGWSQTQLGREIGTSQSHVARIERGTENLMIETCRKLAKALDIDFNALDRALQRQESLFRAKQNDDAPR